MGNRRYILDHRDVEPSSLKRAQSGLTSGTGSFDIRITSYNVCYTKLLRLAVHPHHLTIRLGRIGQGTQDIENRAYTDFLARAYGIFHGAVQSRRKEKADTDITNAPLHNFRGYIEIDAESFENIGASTGRRHRTVAMLSYNFV